jgi:hypothetical protein
MKVGKQDDNLFIDTFHTGVPALFLKGTREASTYVEWGFSLTFSLDIHMLMG